MITINLSAADIEALRYWRFQPPDTRVHVRLEALYLRRQRMANEDIVRLCGISKASFHRDLKAYVTGGLEPLKQIDHDRPQSQLASYRSTLEASCWEPPPATVVEAGAKLTELTGIARQPTQVRQFLKALGMKPRKVGMLPAKADVDAPEAFKKQVWPRRAEARSGHRAVIFRDAAPCVCAPLWGLAGAFNACWSRPHLGGNG